MNNVLTIAHETRYSYEAPVDYALQQVRLTPKSRAGQSVIHWTTEIEGGSIELAYDDHHNNHVELASFEPGRTEIILRSHGEVEVTDNGGVVGQHGGFAPLWYFRRSTALTKPGPHVRKIIKLIDRPDEDIAFMHALSAHILEQVRYETGKTHAATTAEEALEYGHGVCQDHSHIMISAARLLGFPARYVSGYLMMNDRVQQEAMHAWAEVHLDGLGWTGFDVSNGISPDARYVRVSTGLDYSEAAPVSGLRIGSGGREEMLVSIQVQQ